MVGARVRNRIRDSFGDRMLHLSAMCICALAAVVTLYPILYVLSMSISSPVEVLKGNSVWLFPVGFSTTAYSIILRDPLIYRSYLNTIFYTVFGTALNVVMTVVTAYPLSRKGYVAKKLVTVMITVTMFFGGGLIPAFILIKRLGMYNTRWAMIIPGAVQAWYIIITRTFFQTIPESLIESAKLDGARESTILRLMILPLSLPIVAVLILFYAVGHWNSYFSALLYLADSKLHPVQLILMRILTENSAEITSNVAVDLPLILERNGVIVQIKYAIIVVVIAPIVCVYPFLQKYFVKGMLIGSLKG